MKTGTRVMAGFVVLLVSFFALPCFAALQNKFVLEKLCISQDLCKRTMPPLKALPFDTHEPCCLSCSCTPDCVNIGNCCPDIGEVVAPTRPLECIQPVANPEETLLSMEANNALVDIQRYKAVVVCLDNTTDDVLRFNCEAKKAEFPEDLLIIVDPNGLLFKNEFCARCNGVSTFTRWSLRLRGHNADEGMSYTMSEPFSRFNETMFWSEPPSPELHEGSRCFKAIDKCNITGELSYLDPELVEKCNDVSMYYMHHVPSWHGFLMYKNPFCQKCNDRVPSTGPSDILCRPKSSIAFLNDMFSAVVSYPPPSAVDSPADGCHETDAYDSVFKKCRKLFCPLLSMPFHGQCQQHIASVTGLNIAVVFGVQAELSLNSNEVESLYEDAKMILTALETAIMINMCQLCKFDTFVKYDRSTLSLAFRVQYETNADCDASHLLPALAKVVSSGATEFSVKIPTGLVRFVLKILAYDTDLLRQGYEATPYTKGLVLCRNPYVNLTRTTMCPRFELSEAEYESLLKMKTNVTEAEVIDEENGDRKYHICLDQYNTVLAAGQPTFGPSVPVMLVLANLAMTFKF